jgi:DNA gyrase, B subunit
MAEETKISVLRYPDNVRLRKGMYLSSKDQCVFEIVDNSVDEYAAGYCNEIDVSMIWDDDDYIVSVKDNGRGIPTKPSDDPEWKGYSQAEVAMVVLHAGGKFSQLEGAYKTNTGGMNGKTMLF